MSILKLLSAALTVILALLASFGPITAFFAVSSDSYPFMVLLNVAFFGVAGLFGLGFLLQTLQRLRTLEPSPRAAAAPVEKSGMAALEETTQAKPDRQDWVEAVPPPEANDLAPRAHLNQWGKSVFTCWLLVFALVGMQMSWVLRPFIGDPEKDFVWFRPRDSSFVGGLVKSVNDFLLPRR